MQWWTVQEGKAEALVEGASHTWHDDDDDVAGVLYCLAIIACLLHKQLGVHDLGRARSQCLAGTTQSPAPVSLTARHDIWHAQHTYKSCSSVQSLLLQLTVANSNKSEPLDWKYITQCAHSLSCRCLD
jgi:hypothetical protein